MTRLSEFVIARRRWIVVAWVVLTLFGGYAAARADRWLEPFGIPGSVGYEANQGAVEAFSTGEQPPLAPSSGRGDVTDAGARAGGRPGAAPLARLARLVVLDPQRRVRLGGPAHDVRQDLPTGQAVVHAARRTSRGSRPAGDRRLPGVTANVTGRDPLYEDAVGPKGRAAPRGADRRASGR